MQQPQNYTIYSADATANIAGGKVAFCGGFNHVEFDITVTGNVTLKAKISHSDTPPDFTAVASATNQWSYTELIDMLDRSTDSGAGLAMTAGTKSFRLNEDGVKHATLELVSNAGAVTAVCRVS